MGPWALYLLGRKWIAFENNENGIQSRETGYSASDVTQPVNSVSNLDRHRNLPKPFPPSPVLASYPIPLQNNSLILLIEVAIITLDALYAIIIIDCCYGLKSM